MVSRPRRAPVTAGALQQFHPAVISIADGMDLLIDHNVRIFKFKLHARSFLAIP
jgi:hypothetical protein